MPYTASFTVAQQPNLTNLLFTDNGSGGTDNNIIDRQIFLYKVDGTTLVPSGNTSGYIDWPIVNTGGIGDTLNISILSKDYSLNILVNWISTSPITGAVYTKQSVFTFTGFTNSALYKLIQDVSAQPSKLNDANYYSSLQKAYTDLDNCNLAQAYSDQIASQNALDRVFNLVSHENLYF